MLSRGGAAGGIKNIIEKFWSFSENADVRTCTVEITVFDYPVCDVFIFAPDSDLIMSMHVYGPQNH